VLKLENITRGQRLMGVDPGGPVEVLVCEPVGADAVTLVYRRAAGTIGERMVLRSEEPEIAEATLTRPWSFLAGGEAFQLGAEALRIRFAHLFDPMMAVHTSDVEPLPHQISAVYESMLPRQPLRYVLADDPGAGKTIMAGLLIRELIMRSDAQRILVVTPGSLCGQWQDELRDKFGLEFTLFGREHQELSSSGNAFAQHDQLIARLDQLSRSEELQEKLKATHWDLIIVDEAHKLSASFTGNEVKKTQRFQLGELLGSICRHFLLMTATPHNGKEEDFQLFLSLLDGDRFYGKFRDGARREDVSDLMRRLVKEELLKFDGTRLFPERRAYTANFDLSNAEALLYANVTEYVRTEMNRAEKLDGKTKNTVGFALTQLQRRLASSPAAIYQSLHRRRKRREEKLEEAKLAERGNWIAQTQPAYRMVAIDIPDNLDDAEDALTAEDFETVADQIVEQSSAATTIVEMEAELASLRALEAEAKRLHDSGEDQKWRELSQILQVDPLMRDAHGHQRKLIIFTEHRDTLNYLSDKIAGVLGRPSAIVQIHGGTKRDERRRIQEEFRQNKDVQVLVATDAAGEGVNLQNAHLMVNYDLPWNPNRLEQRFGRIHRIGQREVCHLWNLVAKETREGAVFQRLFEKIEIERKALGGRVFDVLGEAFSNTSLKDLLMRAIRYGEREDVRQQLFEVIDNSLDANHLKEIFRRNALVEDHMGLDTLHAIKEEMDRAEARKLQPHFIRAFFLKAFEQLGGEARAREAERYELPHVPAQIRERDRQIGATRQPVLRSYERICFEKSQMRVTARPLADLVHPAHPLMGAVIDLTLEARESALKQGCVLIDPTDTSCEPHLLLIVDHAIREGSAESERIISRQLQFLRVAPDGSTGFAGWAPHLDLRAATDAEAQQVETLLAEAWLSQGLERRALDWAGGELVPQHLNEVRERRLRHVDKVRKAVHERLTKEINHLSHRAITLQEDVRAGKQPRMQPELLRRRAEELTARLAARDKALEAQSHIVSVTPRVVGGALVVPSGWFKHAENPSTLPMFTADAAARARIERIAMQAVMAAERAMGHEPRDDSALKCGYDITSRQPARSDLLPDDRLIEVKGRAKGATTITLTKNEIIAALNKPTQYWLAIVLVNEDDSTEGPYYLQGPVSQAPDWAEVSKNLDISDLLERAQLPEGVRHA
jgi:superfamily II DNA or RNA helicase